MSENTIRGAVRRRVKFFIETPAIFIVSNVELRLAPASLTHLLGRRVNLTKLHELVIDLATNFRNEGALETNVLGLRALEVATVAHFSYETEPLRAAGESANKRG